MTFTAPAKSAALTANGTSQGYATISSNTGFYIGATVWLSATGLTSIECLITELVATNQLGLRRKGTLSYGNTDISAYTTALSAKVDMETQLVPGEKPFDSLPNGLNMNGALTITGVASGSTAIQLVTGNRLNLGGNARMYGNGNDVFFPCSVVTESGGAFITTGVTLGGSVCQLGTGATGGRVTSGTNDGAAAKALTLGPIQTYSNPTSKLVSIDNNGSEKIAWDLNGKEIIPTAGGAAVVGTATLVGGTVTINSTAITASSKVFTSRATSGGTAGHLAAPPASYVAGTSFVINSSSGTDTSTVHWRIVN